MPLRVLVVDDSPTFRALLREGLERDPELSVVAEARNGTEAVSLVESVSPDVVVMDVEMPELDGYEATRRIMAERPTPVVVVSGSSERAVRMSVAALEAGALTALTKPPGPSEPGSDRAWRRFARTVRAMAEVRVVRRPNGADRERPSQPPRRETSVIAMAASTGGPRAVRTILESLGEDFPAPILLVQHIGEDFAEGFARWLDATVPMDVRLAREGDPLRAGAVYLAPPRGHLTVHKGAIRVCDRAPIHGFRPSASATYASVARAYGERALGLILTGMGRDGVEGLRELHRRGGLVVAQDASTSVVDSMPASARRAGIVHEVLPLPDISAYLRSCVA
ncbi:MAG: chemotaxis-specific protein-glutamate methyltransferase CheB [Sandaracinaceae bacterium]|nr:MAG: chemotaxis-specific protein-glutamate methyltransferase CheB [Sandaracinaceae bacterium]